MTGEVYLFFHYFIYCQLWCVFLLYMKNKLYKTNSMKWTAVIRVLDYFKEEQRKLHKLLVNVQFRNTGNITDMIEVVLAYPVEEYTDKMG